MNQQLKTSNPNIYAIGDVMGGPQFTHLANYHAGIVIRNALFRLRPRASAAHIPRVTYTDPELAQVGLTEAEARKKYRRIRILRWPYADNDRAQAESTTHGFIKVITRPNGQILGCTIVGAEAGELLQLWIMALARDLRIGDLTWPRAALSHALRAVQARGLYLLSTLPDQALVPPPDRAIATLRLALKKAYPFA